MVRLQCPQGPHATLVIGGTTRKAPRTIFLFLTTYRAPVDFRKEQAMADILYVVGTDGLFHTKRDELPMP